MKHALPRLGSLLRPTTQPIRLLARPTTARAAFHSTARAPQPAAATTGSGIPFVSIYSQESDVGAVIGGLTEDGIEIAAPTNLVIPGSAIILGGRTLLWDVRPPAKGEELSWKGWHEDAFKLFEVVGPRPEMLLLGTGERTLPPPPFLRAYLSKLGIQLDVMSTRDACSTYNLLAEEGRAVAVALISLKPIDVRRPALATA